MSSTNGTRSGEPPRLARSTAPTSSSTRRTKALRASRAARACAAVARRRTGFVFTQSSARHHHDLAGTWTFGSPTGRRSCPGPTIARIADDRIKALYVFIEPRPLETHSSSTTTSVGNYLEVDPQWATGILG